MRFIAHRPPAGYHSSHSCDIVIRHDMSLIHYIVRFTYSESKQKLIIQIETLNDIIEISIWLLDELVLIAVIIENPNIQIKRLQTPHSVCWWWAGRGGGGGGLLSVRVCAYVYENGMMGWSKHTYAKYVRHFLRGRWRSHLWHLSRLPDTEHRSPRPIYQIIVAWLVRTIVCACARARAHINRFLQLQINYIMNPSKLIRRRRRLARHWRAVFIYYLNIIFMFLLVFFSIIPKI